MLKLETERLILRDLETDDIKLFYDMSVEEKITNYQKWFLGKNGYKQWVEDSIDHNKRIPRFAYNLAIVLRKNGKAIGWIGWGTDDLEKCEYDFGYSLLPDYWNSGFMTEALKCGIDYMINKLNASIVFGDCVDDNIGSARVMEKAGLMLTKEWEELNNETNKVEKRKQYSKKIKED
ncbi:MAG: GNAT family N-acetyltransferase [Treponema sp.]|jgi:ribosomal-protein-alanine N-acetyltransferase|nr:GNAT family N-acetyltransferase [Treponema sp.]